APPVSLVVIITTGIHTEVPANGPHVTQLRRGYQTSSRGQRRVASQNIWLLAHVRERHTGPKGQALPRVASQPVQFSQLTQANKGLWLKLPALHVRIEVGTSSH